jgi:tRNA pseudouridine38-40 synthase
MKRNYKMTISYDGTRYSGWEHQPTTDMTIQGKLETVLTRMCGLPEDQPVTVIGAGRTDAGVHALAMTANVLLDTPLSEDGIRDYLNRYLPEDISVNELKICADRFHSRFKAKGKTYRYTLWRGKAKPVFDRKYVTIPERVPDPELLSAGIKKLVGMHDFKGFCGNPRMKKTTVRVIYDARVEAEGDYLRLYFHGNGFLQNQVRIMVGTLLEIGTGDRAPESIDEILERGERRLAGPTAPAQGLCMMQVDY